MSRKTVDLINGLTEVINDPEIRITDLSLVRRLEFYRAQLRKGAEPNLVCAKLSGIITQYLVLHKFKASKSIIALDGLIESGNNKYRGYMSMANWFL